MHIAEGVLSIPVLTIGAAVAVGGLVIGLRHMDERNLASCAIFSAVFFVGSLIHVPIGFANAHLLLCGLLGVMLGWASFPAIFIALLLQAILFQYGGLSTLGVNTFTMGSAAVSSWFVFKCVTALARSKAALFTAGFLSGFIGIAFSSILTAMALAFTDEGFYAAAIALLVAHFPVMLAEGIITAFTVLFVARVKPGLLNLSIPARQPHG